ncbi:hypothetical protein B0T14DRAFT_545214 [Immersiella caudata]|uniref:Rhodopsin domain-containing protein n=1 Tax=Immersiella caudata TaxID=314043 RepID=A0AA39WYK6_9PEZI|nr:hypothetical protein B0T14DRAFT_545214 [Immersiella caudata]
MAIPTGPPLTPEQIALLPHDDMGPALMGIVWVLTVVAAAFLAARVWCKTHFSGTIWWDDIVLIGSFVCLLIQVCITSHLVSLGYGRHIWDFPMENFPKFTLPVAVRAVFSITALAWSKTAFGITLLRLTSGWMKRVVWFIIISVNIALGISALLFFVQCKPIAAAWDFTIEGECLDNQILYKYNVFSGTWGAAMDFALALLPWQMLAKLQMRRKEKIGVGLAMSMGVVAGIAAIVKTVNLDKLHNSQDLYETIPLFIWDTVEAAVTIVAASIPVLRVLIRDVRSTLAKSGRSRTGVSSRTTGGRTKLSHIGMSNLSKADRASKFQPMDSRSDKSILYETQIDVQSPASREDQDGRIVRTDTVMIEFDGRKERADLEKGQGRR